MLKFPTVSEKSAKLYRGYIFAALCIALLPGNMAALSFMITGLFSSDFT